MTSKKRKNPALLNRLDPEWSDLLSGQTKLYVADKKTAAAGPKKHVCKFCHHSFKSAAGLISHEKTHIGTILKPKLKGPMTAFVKPAQKLAEDKNADSGNDTSDGELEENEDAESDNEDEDASDYEDEKKEPPPPQQQQPKIKRRRLRYTNEKKQEVLAEFAVLLQEEDGSDTRQYLSRGGKEEAHHPRIHTSGLH
jgi:hypothetical protein